MTRPGRSHGLHGDSGRLRCTVLIVDDDPDIRTVMGVVLNKAGMTVLTACDAAEGFLAALDGRPDLALVDVAMPGEDGLGLCRRLKRDSRTRNIPILFLSGTRNSVYDQIDGLEGGGDDYLSKPIDYDLVAAKVRAVLRGRNAKAIERTLRDAGVTLDVDGRTVLSGKKRVPLTRKEFDLLSVLLRSRGKVLSIPHLLQSVWGHDPARRNDPATVHTHVSNLRRKLGKPFGARVASLPGLGYRFE